MSCYLMKEEDIGAIAAANFNVYKSKGRFYNAAKKTIVEYESAEEAANKLALQNIASCQARYPYHGAVAGGFLKNVEEKQAYLAGVANATRKADYMEPMKLYSLVKTYEYQACETEDWYETNAYWFCNHVAHEAAGAEARAQEEKEAA